MKKAILMLLFVCQGSGILFGQLKFAKWTSTQLILDNGIISRTIELPSNSGHFITTSYKPTIGTFTYFTNASTDFQFEVNEVTYSGKGNWSLFDIREIKDDLLGEGAAVVLVSDDKKVEVTIRFLLYPDSPVIRKNLVIRNLANQQVAVESVDVEKFVVTGYYATTFSWIYSDYGRRKSIGPYEGNMQDALVVVHNPDWEAGIVIGNESTGVLKRTSVFWDAPEITSGLTHKNARFPFRKWIKPGESFSTPYVFTMVYSQQKTPEEMLNHAVPDFIREHMGIRLSVLEEKPTFVYNTWKPFKTEINEKLIMELAKAAAAAGMKEFVIDDGWQDNYGDWGINKEKFPNGLKPVFDYIKSLGMKPGLWVSVGSASSVSKVYHQHPEWFVRGKDGDFANLQIEGDQMDVRSACFSTGWKDHIRTILSQLCLDYGLEYLKLDFAVVSSAYIFDTENSGCYASDHPGHVDHHESMYVNYERMWELFDELHTTKPSLFIDCTFEAMGGLQLIDYSMLKHAEGNWLSNFYAPDDAGDLRVRNMAWWRSPAAPATALVIGNPGMDDKGWEMHIKSLAGALPILLGDPRKLSAVETRKYRMYSDWLKLMEEKYDIMSYRQDLHGFGEPMVGVWDGFQRINTKNASGGIIGVFRDGASETKRSVTVSFLNPEKIYKISRMDGKVITSLTGKALREQGFEVTLSDPYSGELYEVSSK